MQPVTSDLMLFYLYFQSGLIIVAIALLAVSLIVSNSFPHDS